MKMAVEFLIGFVSLPLVIGEIVGTMYCLNGFSWNIGRPYDYPMLIAGMVTWFPLMFVVGALLSARYP